MLFFLHISRTMACGLSWSQIKQIAEYLKCCKSSMPLNISSQYHHDMNKREQLKEIQHVEIWLVNMIKPEGVIMLQKKVADH